MKFPVEWGGGGEQRDWFRPRENISRGGVMKLPVEWRGDHRHTHAHTYVCTHTHTHTQVQVVHERGRGGKGANHIKDSLHGSPTNSILCHCQANHCKKAAEAKE